MISLKRVAKEIRNVGLYDLILQDVQDIAGKNSLSIKEIISILNKNPQILREYKQVNIEYNLSNIHIDKLTKDNINIKHHKEIETINQNLKKMKEIEKYTLEFEHSSVLVIIFSVEFFVLFSVQYFIVLLDLKKWQLYIYALFLSSIIFAWMYARKEKKLYDTNSKEFNHLYEKTKSLIDVLEKNSIISRDDIYEETSKEHV